MIRKAVIIGLLAFAVFFIIQSPVQAAEMVRGTLDGAADLLTAVADAFATFLTQLF